MPKEFVIKVDDADIAGITWARERYNALLPQKVDVLDGEGKSKFDDEGKPEKKSNPDLMKTDGEYLQRTFVLAIKDYGKQKRRAALEAQLQE